MTTGIVREVRFPRAYARDGLRSDISLTNLSNVVVLTGPNGGGKTRLLHRIQDEIDAGADRSNGDQSLEMRHTVLRYAEKLDPARVRTLRVEGIIPWAKPVGDYSYSELRSLARNIEYDADSLPTLMENALAILQSASTARLFAFDSTPAQPPGTARYRAWSELTCH